MTIRAATTDDHRTLAEIFLQARRETFTWEDVGTFRLADFALQTKGETIRLAETSDGEVAGFISVWEPENFVHHLFVTASHRGKGVGRALLADLKRRAPGPFLLKCVSANVAAFAFYRRLGWTVTGHGETEPGPYLLMESGHLPDGFGCRLATGDDIGFLWDLHILTMRDYAEQTWGRDRMWQEENFPDKFNTAGLEILELDGEAAGAMSVLEKDGQFYLREIQLHPRWQGRGIGTALVEEFVARAAARGLPARLQVLKVNRARRLYERCGFQLAGETETHFLMEHAGDT